MAYIDLDNELPGLLGPMNQYPDITRPLSELSQRVLRGDSPLSPAQRELIAAYTSKQNDCHFCRRGHAATAKQLYGDEGEIVDQALEDSQMRALDPKMRALLWISGKVAEDGNSVQRSDVDAAREQGATDREIHDTVLVTAAFCMFNRYVDGLGTMTPKGDEVYEQYGRHLAENGYGPVEGRGD